MDLQISIYRFYIYIYIFVITLVLYRVDFQGFFDDVSELQGVTLVTGVASKPLDPPSGKKFAPVVRVKPDVTGQIIATSAQDTPQMVV